ncbi:MAG: hypothetical protein G3M70_07230 [Candidatus Nitronauta litoralis]|uniref:Uncharacterized protein n=1 Tax=Candidatus Nitronauta litoralis TaxID=2705533 RepID=A0A7T0BVF8_9BACT|nr:MAG: hypothetical protein G3M70_07230 [Candidatus Nitronauta litoralis]
MINPGMAEVIRGQVLELLSTDFDGKLSSRVLLLMLNQAGHSLTKADVSSILRYLAGAGKELIDFKKHDNETWYAMLLPKGRDLLEGRIEVTGVMCPYCGD